jgi:4'-phosphopantetheinyl transferase
MDRAGSRAFLSERKRTPPTTLPAGEVHVWFHEGSGSSDSLAMLSEEERARAWRFRSHVHREQYVTAHLFLRRKLGEYCSLPPEQLVFEAGLYGKPHLRGLPLHFNLSHSGHLVMLAISSTDVGADVEQVAARPDLLAIADRFFAPGEGAALRALPVSGQVAGFYRLWTLKESFMKATGEGFSAGIQSFDLSEGLTANTLVHAGWNLRIVDAGEGFVSAVCYRRANLRVRRFTG